MAERLALLPVVKILKRSEEEDDCHKAKGKNE
jgi:hypothetical protein